MKVGKKMSAIVASSLLLTLVSCGGDSSSSNKRKEANTVCEDLSCYSSLNWKIALQGRVFPDKTRIDINGTTVLNECVSKQKYMIDRDAVPQYLYLENYTVPKRGDLKIKVLDLGHCDSASTFIEDNNVNFEMVKHGLGREIQINL